MTDINWHPADESIAEPERRAISVTTPPEPSLTPTEELILEVLAARWRTGEHTWTFSSRMRTAANRLADRGLVGMKSGIVENTILVWFTDAGRSLTLSDTYTPPNAAFSDGWTAARDLLADERERIAADVAAGNTDMRFYDGISHAWSALLFRQPSEPER